MSDLKTNLQEILQEKQDKIIPENIKKDVQIFDVTGTYEGSGSPTGGDVKLFETEEEMQADSTAQEGDLAVVYREEIQNMTANTQTQYITFPETVVLPEAFASDVYCGLRAVDETVMFDGQVMLNQSMFDFNGYTSSGMIRVRYTSNDGITYNRDEFRGDSGALTNPVDLGTIVGVYSSEEWDDNFGYFLQASGMNFDGLYKYTLYNDQNRYTVSNRNKETLDIDITDINEKLKEIFNLDVNSTNYIVCITDFTLNENGTTIPTSYNMYKVSVSHLYRFISNNITAIALRLTGSASTSCEKVIITNGVAGDIQEISVSTSSTSIVPDYYIVDEVPNNCYFFYQPGYYVMNDAVYMSDKTLPTTEEPNYSMIDITPILTPLYTYEIAPTQLTLDNVNQLLPNISAYGKNGVITGDGSIWNDIPEGVIYSNILDVDLSTLDEARNHIPADVLENTINRNTYGFSVDSNKDGLYNTCLISSGTQFNYTANYPISIVHNNILYNLIFTNNTSTYSINEINISDGTYSTTDSGTFPKTISKVFGMIEYNNKIYLFCVADSNIYGYNYDLDTHKLINIWSTSVSVSNIKPLLYDTDDGKIYFRINSSNVYKFDILTGENSIVLSDLPESSIYDSLMYNNSPYFMTSDNTVINVFKKADNTLLTTISSPGASSNTMGFSFNGYTYIIKQSGYGSENSIGLKINETNNEFENITFDRNIGCSIGDGPLCESIIPDPYNSEAIYIIQNKSFGFVGPTMYWVDTNSNKVNTIFTGSLKQSMYFLENNMYISIGGIENNNRIGKYLFGKITNLFDTNIPLIISDTGYMYTSVDNYNTNNYTNTISPEEYNIALDTSEQILGEEETINE